MKTKNNKTKIKQIGLVPVDSGSVLIADPCNTLTRDKNTVDVLTFEEYMDEKIKQKPEDWVQAEEIKLRREPDNPVFNRDFKEGIVVTGFGGDGMYPVSIEIIDDENSFWNGCTKSVTITFIEDSEV